jgi:pimeloyl-ACP methyl ester carboxylesterase
LALAGLASTGVLTLSYAHNKAVNDSGKILIMAALRRSSGMASISSPRVIAVALAVIAALFALLLALNWQPDRSVESLRERWAPAPSQFMRIDGMQVHVRDQGPRDDFLPIILLHGTGASLHTWEGWVATLSATRRVITVDLPGHGLTGPDPAGDYTNQRYVRFVTALADALGIQRFALGGNSLGGEIAWETAVAHPARVMKLILVDAAGYPLAPRSVPIGFRIARTPVLNRLAEVTLPRSLVAASVRNVYGNPDRVTVDLVDRYFDLTLRSGNRRAMAQRFAQMQPGARAALVLTIKTPTLILWGGQDRLIPPELGRRFALEIAGSRLVVFEPLGHVPQEEDPATTVQPVLQFLQLPVPRD